MKKATMIWAVLLAVVVIGAVFVSAAIKQQGEEKTNSATGQVISESDPAQQTCGANCGCGGTCGGTCGIAGCGCGK
jgi:hypothetical protein